MIQTTNPKQKRYDLEERTFVFAQKVFRFATNLPKTACNQENRGQLIRAAGSIGANYIEANEALGKKDFLMRIKISKKEAKETGFWLKLIEILPEQVQEKFELIREAGELMKIFGAIIEKSK